MQEKMLEAQQKLAAIEVTGESGAGLVKLIMTGKNEVRKVSIDVSLYEEKDQEMLEDLIAAAINDAVQKVDKVNKDNMSDMAAGIPLPPGFKLPF
jgi:hypothetical protein